MLYGMHSGGHRELMGKKRVAINASLKAGIEGKRVAYIKLSFSSLFYRIGCSHRIFIEIVIYKTSGNIGSFNVSWIALNTF